MGVRGYPEAPRRPDRPEDRSRPLQDRQRPLLGLCCGNLWLGLCCGYFSLAVFVRLKKSNDFLGVGEGGFGFLIVAGCLPLLLPQLPLAPPTSSGCHSACFLLTSFETVCILDSAQNSKRTQVLWPNTAWKEQPHAPTTQNDESNKYTCFGGPHRLKSDELR